MRICLLEDDPDQADILSMWLEDAGHQVVHFAGADDLLRHASRDTYDMYLFDWILGGDKSGFDTLTLMRQRSEDMPPIVFTTVREQEESIVRALNAGADDYLVKPLRQSELVARVNAIGRRAGLLQGEQPSIDYGRFHFDLTQEVVMRDGAPIELRRKEYELALFLFQRAEALVSRQHILECIWGLDESRVYTRTVDTHVSRIRKKMRLGEETGWVLKSVYQQGYRLVNTDRDGGQRSSMPSS